MSNKKQETIADIVREMRQRFEPYAKSDSNDARYVAYLGYAEFADRIDAAHKREREAGAEAAQICGEIGEMVGREAAWINLHRLETRQRIAKEKQERRK